MHKKLSYICPVCQKFLFKFSKKLEDEDDIQCNICGWIFDINQYNNHELKDGLNNGSVNEMIFKYNDIIKADPDYVWLSSQYVPVPHLCPVCGKTEFPYEHSYDICEFCGWEDNGFDSLESRDWTFLLNSPMTFNLYKKEYEDLIKINPNYKWIDSIKK